mgnify:CR=1 FL=1
MNGKVNIHNIQWYITPVLNSCIRVVYENESWGEPVVEDLDYNKQYFAIKADKNRSGDKDKIMAFEIDLNYNIWDNVGYIIKKTKNSN